MAGQRQQGSKRSRRPLPGRPSTPVRGRTRVARYGDGVTRRGLPSWLTAKRPVLRFFIICSVLMVCFCAAYYAPPWESESLESFFKAYRGFYAAVSAEVLGLLGTQATARDQLIISSEMSLKIVRSCEAMEATALLICAVVAAPVSIRRKLAGIVAGVLVLAVVNVVRIVSLFFIGVHFPSAFEMMHMEVWQAVFVVLSISLWVVWARWAARSLGKGDASA